MSSYQQPPPPPGPPPTGFQQPGFQQPQQPQPQQGFQTPPYWPNNQTPPQYQQGSMPLPAPPAQMPQPGAPPPGAPVGAPVPPATMPMMHQVDDEAMAAQYKRAKEEMKGGGVGFFKVLGPSGQVKWDSSVPVGYEGSSFVHICGPWAAGKPIYVTKKSYFWMSHSKPKGTSIVVPPTGDLVAQAIELGKASMDPKVQKFCSDFGKARTNYVYQVLQLDNPMLHVGQDGVMRPLILDEGKQLHTSIGDVFTNAEGASKIVDYQNGRPVRIIRKKTGHQKFDIEWTAMPSMNPVAVPQDFWPALQNLWDLEAFVKYPTLEEMQAAILDMGLPMPGQAMQVQVPAGFNPGAAPPYPNPYIDPQHQQAMQPMQPQMGAAPPPPPMGPPPQMAPQMAPQVAPQMAPPMAPPEMAPPPVYSAPPQGQAPQGAPPVAPQMAPQMAPQVAPPMSPPPVSSVAPQAPQGGPPPVPGAVPASAPQTAQPAPQGGQALSLPLPQGTQLPEGRERCFGGYNQTDNFCIQCPDWVKAQCISLSGTATAQPAGGELAALQQQLQG